MQQAPRPTGQPTQPPGPRGLPIVGNALGLTRGDMLDYYLDLWKTHGDITHLKLGPLDAYVLVNPEHTHHVLVKNQKNYIKGRGYDGFRLLVGQGLVTSEGALWQRQRRLMQPSFTPGGTANFTGLMVESTRRMIELWDNMARQGQTLHIDAEMMRLTMTIIGLAMFGVDLSVEATEISRAFQSAFEFITDRSLNPLALPLHVPTPGNRRFNRDVALLHQFIRTRIEEGRRNPDQPTLLGTLLRATDDESGTQMDDRQLLDEVITLFFAGFETTARTLTWGWELLSWHPDVADRVAAEAAPVFAGRTPELADLFRLPYTRMVADETLRMYPPTALLARQAVAADTIGGYNIPAGAMIILVPYLVHRHPSAWTDPDRFDPERFTPEASGERPKYAYIPFASGPRVCLGNNFALLELVIALGMVLSHFRLERIDSQPLGRKYVGTIRPDRPLLLRLQRRPVPTSENQTA